MRETSCKRRVIYKEWQVIYEKRQAILKSNLKEKGA
jgi:hypothetical protein